MINFGRKKQVQRKENLIVDVHGMFQIKEKVNRIFFASTWNELQERFFAEQDRMAASREFRKAFE